MVVDVQKRRLAVLFPHNEEDGLDELYQPQSQEEPSAESEFRFLLLRQEVETFAPPQEAKVEAHLVRAHHEDRAGNHLEDVVPPRDVGDVVGRQVLHVLRAFEEDVPKVADDEHCEGHRDGPNERRLILER